MKLSKPRSFIQLRVYSPFLIAALTLTSCSSDTSENTKTLLEVACDGIEKYVNSSDPSIRQIEIDRARSNFRKAALESSEIKYEVLADYSRKDTPNLEEIENFCKEL